MIGYGYDSAKFLGVGATEANIIPYGITSPTSGVQDKSFAKFESRKPGISSI